MAERLKEEVEGKGIIPGNQTSFRKGLGTLDNISVINYLVNMQWAKKRGGMVALFVDLKAAFDSIDKGVLVEAIRDKKIKARLVGSVEEAIRERRSRVGVGGEWEEIFRPQGG